MLDAPSPRGRGDDGHRAIEPPSQIFCSFLLYRRIVINDAILFTNSPYYVTISLTMTTDAIIPIIPEYSVGHLEEILGSLPEPPIPEANNLTTKWEPKHLSHRHREIMRRMLEGADRTTIANEMGITTQAVTIISTSKLFQSALAEMELNADFKVIQRAENLSNEALDHLKNLMRFARSEAIKLRAADSILDRAGYAKVEKKMIGIVSGDDVIKELNRRRREETINTVDI